MASKQTKEQVFDKLCVDFKIADPVKKLLMDSNMDTLDDLKFYWSESSQVDSFVAGATAELADTLKVQISRVRQAWQSLHDVGAQAKHKQSGEAAAELDDLLEEVTLRDIKVQFWRRYKLKYPAEIMPGDRMVSRCFRELDRRLLSVTDIWTVKSLMIQVTTTKKRKRVGEDLWMMEEEMPSTQTRSIARYLDLLFTYLLALSIAGSQKPASGTNDQEVFGSDSTSHVSAPWDLLQGYYFRAARSVQMIQENQRLAWLEKVDVQERSIWVSQFRDGAETIGQVVKNVMERRSTHWEPPPMQHSFNPYQPQADSPARKGKGDKGSPQTPPPGKGGGKPNTFASTSPVGKPGETAKTLRDGKVLCPAFQTGKCQNKGFACPNGTHKCAKVLASGRVCGMNFHGAEKCRAR